MSSSQLLLFCLQDLLVGEVLRYSPAIIVGSEGIRRSISDGVLVFPDGLLGPVVVWVSPGSCSPGHRVVDLVLFFVLPFV